MKLSFADSLAGRQVKILKDALCCFGHAVIFFFNSFFVLGFVREAVRQGKLCAWHPGDESISKMSPLGHVAMVGSAPQGPGTHQCTKGEAFPFVLET